MKKYISIIAIAAALSTGLVAPSFAQQTSHEYSIKECEENNLKIRESFQTTGYSAKYLVPLCMPGCCPSNDWILGKTDEKHEMVAFVCILTLTLSRVVVCNAAATSQPSPYVVDGLALGGKVHFESQAYKQYRCAPSDTSPGFIWCHKEEKERGKVTSSTSILHSEDGTAVYVNRYIEPALFGPQDVGSEIDRLSAKFGERPREYRMPSREGLPNAVIVVWGKIKLEQLDAAEVSLWAKGKSHQGLLISYLGSIQRSVEERVPVYRLAGGPGYLWAATFDREGRGALRFLTVDASRLAPSPPQPPQNKPPSNGSEEACGAIPSREPFILNGKAYKVSKEVFSILDDVPDKIKLFYGKTAQLADWTELKQALNGKEALIRFIRATGLPLQADDVGLPGRCGNLLVRRGSQDRLGDFFLFVARHDGRVPTDWAVLDTIGNHTLDLGRWNYSSQALVSIPTAAPEGSRRISEWSITHQELSDASYCTAAGQFSDKTTLQLALVQSDKGEEWFLLISNPEWEVWVAKKSQHDLLLLTTGARHFTFNVSDDKKTLILGGASIDFIKSLADSHPLRIFDESEQPLASLDMTAADSAIKAVVNCVQENPFKHPPESISGTAFFVTPNFLATNNHVVVDCKEPIMVRNPEERTTYPATIYALDNTNDLALLRIKTRDTSVASFRTELSVGDTVATYGFPLSSSGDFTVGYVTSLTGPGEDTRYLQMSTPVQHGNSGGPLLDMSGNVVGVVTSGLRGEYQNVNFAIRAPIVINFLLAKGVPPRLDMPNANQTLTPQKVARLAKEFTVQVYCETTSRKTSEAGPKPEDTNHILRRPGPPR